MSHVTVTVAMKDVATDANGDLARDDLGVVKVTRPVLGPDDVTQAAEEAAERAIALGNEAQRQQDESDQEYIEVSSWQEREPRRIPVERPEKKT